MTEKKSAKESAAVLEVSVVYPMLQQKSAHVRGLVEKAATADVKGDFIKRLDEIDRNIVDHINNPGGVLAQFVFAGKIIANLYAVEILVRESRNSDEDKFFLDDLKTTKSSVDDSLKKLDKLDMGEGILVSKEQLGDLFKETKLPDSDHDYKFGRKRDKAKDATTKPDIGPDRFVAGVLRRTTDELRELKEKQKQKPESVGAKNTVDKNKEQKKSESQEAEKKQRKQKAKDEREIRKNRKKLEKYASPSVINKIPDEFFMAKDAVDTAAAFSKETGSPLTMRLVGAALEKKLEKYKGKSDREYYLLGDKIRIISNDEVATEEFESYIQRAYAQQPNSLKEAMTFQDHEKYVQFLDIFTDEEAVEGYMNWLNENKMEGRRGKKYTMAEAGDEARKKLARFSNEYTARSMIYLSQGVKRGWLKPDKMQEMLASMTSELWGYIFPKDDAAGVSFAATLYENVYREELDLHDKIDWSRIATLLRDGGLAESDLDEKVRNGFRNMIRMQTIMELYPDEYTSGKLKGGHYQKIEREMMKKWPDWKVNKALALGESYFILNLRAAEITAEGRWNKEGWGDLKEMHERLESQPFEDLVRILDTEYYFNDQYWTGGPMGALLYFAYGDQYKRDDDGNSIGKKSFQEMYDEWESGKAHYDIQYMNEVRNLLEIGGQFTQSGWRGVVSGEEILKNHENLHFALGANIRLQGIETVHEQELLSLKQSIKSMSHDDGKKALENWMAEKRTGVWEDTLYYNPMGFMHEAQSLYSHSKDYSGGLWAEIYTRMGGDKDDKWIVEAREDLNFVQSTSLSMVNMKDLSKVNENKNTFLKFDLIQDKTRRKNALRLFEEIKKKAGEGVEWADNGNPKSNKHYDSLSNLLGKKMHFLKQGLVQNDIRVDLLRFEKQGHVGWVRRFRDLGGAAQLAHELPAFNSVYASLADQPHKLADYIVDKVLPGMQAYDGKKANRFAEKITKGILEIHKEPEYMRVWGVWPINKLMDATTRMFNIDDNAAELLMGEEAAMYNSVMMREFIGRMRLRFAYGAGDVANHAEHRLEKEFHARINDVAWQAVRRYGPFAIFVVGNLLLKELIDMVEQDTTGGGGTAKKSKH